MADKPTKEPRGKAAVVVSMADAARELDRKKHRRADPPPMAGRGPEKNIYPPKWPGQPPNWTPNDLGLPSEDPCPVVALGTEKNGNGVLYHMLDSAGQFVSYEARDFSHAGMQSLFAKMPNWPQWAWPRFGRGGGKDVNGNDLPAPIKTFDDDHLRQALMLACSREGLFSPTDKLRGRGMWLNRAGGLLYHAGEELWEFDAHKGIPVARETGLYEGFLYPRYPRIPAPWTAAITPGDNPVRGLLELLRGPNYTRPEIDPVLMLGWIGVAYIGGALDWRSAVLLLGDKGTGKSTLQNDLKALFGEALFHSSDTSAAGIYQKMAHDTRPIALDELEPGAHSSKVDNVVNLMRGSSSGAIGRRGSSGGTASEYQMRSAFLFSAINNPLHSSQDLSRVAILRLNELKPGQQRPPVINADTCGRMVLTTLMREWPRFAATYAVYREALKAGGHVARGQDTYGTLLAAADMLIGPELGGEMRVPLCEEPEWWTEHLAVGSLSEVEDAAANWRKCLETILTSPIDTVRNGRVMTAGAVLQLVAVNHDSEAVVQARQDLAAAGLGLLVPGEAIEARDTGMVLGIPNDHPLLKRLLRDTDWSNGGWKDALRQCPLDGVMVFDSAVNRITIGGVQKRGTLVCMDRFKKAPER